MATFATLSDLLEQEQSIQEYGLLDWSQELASAQAEVVRHINIRWFKPWLNQRSLDESTPINIDLLDATQWTKATVYYCIAHQICPKLTKFEASGDRFQIMMDYYAKRYDTEFDILLRSGISYDLNEDDSFSDGEKLATQSLRLQR
jgi:hypothetical protein